MSMKMPILINGNEVGQVVITRQQNPPGNDEDWRYHRYRWEAREWHHGWRNTRGEVQHKPSDGMFALIAAVCEDVRRISLAKLT